jgi:hypothetical protein
MRAPMQSARGLRGKNRIKKTAGQKQLGPAIREAKV